MEYTNEFYMQRFHKLVAYLTLKFQPLFQPQNENILYKGGQVLFRTTQTLIQ